MGAATGWRVIRPWPERSKSLRLSMCRHARSARGQTESGSWRASPECRRSQSGRARATGAAKGRRREMAERGSSTAGEHHHNHMPATRRQFQPLSASRRREPVLGEYWRRRPPREMRGFSRSPGHLHAEDDGLRHAIDYRSDHNSERTAAAFGAELAVHIALAKNESARAEHGPHRDLPHLQHLGVGNKSAATAAISAPAPKPARLPTVRLGTLTMNTARPLTTSDSCASAPRPKDANMGLVRSGAIGETAPSSVFFACRMGLGNCPCRIADCRRRRSPGPSSIYFDATRRTASRI